MYYWRSVNVKFKRSWSCSDFALKICKRPFQRRRLPLRALSNASPHACRTLTCVQKVNSIIDSQWLPRSGERSATQHKEQAGRATPQLVSRQQLRKFQRRSTNTRRISLLLVVIGKQVFSYEIAPLWKVYRIVFGQDNRLQPEPLITLRDSRQTMRVRRKSASKSAVFSAAASAAPFSRISLHFWCVFSLHFASEQAKTACFEIMTGVSTVCTWLNEHFHIVILQEP